MSILIKKELLEVNHNIINTDLEELKKLGVSDIDIKKSNRIIKNEESKLIKYVSKLRDINKLLNNYEKSVDWDSQYKDVKERELAEMEKNKIKIMILFSSSINYNGNWYARKIAERGNEQKRGKSSL